MEFYHNTPCRLNQKLGLLNSPYFTHILNKGYNAKAKIITPSMNSSLEQFDNHLHSLSNKISHNNRKKYYPNIYVNRKTIGDNLTYKSFSYCNHINNIQSKDQLLHEFEMITIVAMNKIKELQHSNDILEQRLAKNDKITNEKAMNYPQEFEQQYHN